MSIIDTRLADLEAIELLVGFHGDNDEHHMCVMEAVAYVAGEPWTDHPACACSVLTAFMVSWNDQLNDTDRQRLKPYIPRLVGTRSTREVESVRSWMACDWLVRTFTPAWLRLAGLDDDAAALEALPELTSTELADAAMPTITVARDHSRAAWDAAGDAARAAAGAAAWYAAGAAAGDAAGAPAWYAAGAAAWDAAEEAAGAAAGAALAPTVLALQDSAFDLLDRLIEVRP